MRVFALITDPFSGLVWELDQASLPESCVEHIESNNSVPLRQRQDGDVCSRDNPQPTPSLSFPSSPQTLPTTGMSMYTRGTKISIRRR